MENTTGHMPINFWAEDDRPREKMLLKGKHNLSDAELIAILIGSGTRHASAVDLAKNILQRAHNNLIELAKLTVTDLTRVQGIGSAKAITIMAALELGRRRRSAEVFNREKVQTSRDAYEIFQAKVSEENYEAFWIMLLNRSNKIIGMEKISDGGISGTVADPKKIFKLALDHYASCIILCHNHPSGSTDPSQADMQLTGKLVEAGKYLDIEILDHIIVGDEIYYSFADDGKI
ncbi:MAG: DNA repair protein RadC [Bacteroidetes bacterium]|nr:DNA repair protein RadC [Bacteroidota bacterium]